MAYDDAPTKYEWGLVDFGGGSNVLFHIIGPKGKGGMLYDFGVQNTTEAFAAGTATPMMSVGTPADADAYGEEFDFGALATTHGMSVRSRYYPADAAFEAIMVDQSIPVDQEVMVTCVAGTGSGLTGQGYPFVEIIWDR